MGKGDRHVRVVVILKDMGMKFLVREHYVSIIGLNDATRESPLLAASEREREREGGGGGGGGGWRKSENIDNIINILFIVKENKSLMSDKREVKKTFKCSNIRVNIFPTQYFLISYLLDIGANTFLCVQISFVF